MSSVEDESGNSSTVCSFNITITDDQAPDILGCPANITRSNTLNECQSVVSWTEPTATDNCTSSGNIVWTKSHTPGNIFPVGTTTVTYTAEDEAGNTSTCTFDVTVLDNQKPVISNCPGNISQSADGGICNAVVTWTEPTATDNCTEAGNLIWTKSHTSGSTFSTGTTTVTYTAEDEAGNVSLTCSFDVTIADEVNPVALCQDITVYLDSDGEGSITANDIDNGSSDNCNLSDLSIDISNFDCDDTGANTVTLTATDAVSNTATCTSTVTVLDTIVPVLAPKPTPTTKYVDMDGCVYTISSAEFDPDASDNCSVSLLEYSLDGSEYTGTDATTSLADVTLDEGVHNIIWRATDASGNVSAVWDFDVTVIDNQAPQISAMANKFRNTNDGCTYVISGTEFDVSITDNCGSGSLTQTYQINTEDPVTATTLNGVALQTGSNTIVWTASDGSNESTRSFIVNVTDNDAPEIQTINDITNNSADNCQTTVTWTTPTVSDNCDASPSLTQIVGPASGSTFDLGTTLIKYKAQDDAGNISYMEFNVIIENNNPPTIVCPIGSPFTRTAPEGSCYYTVVGTEFNPTSYAGCDVTITNDYDGTSNLTGKQITGGTHTITWTATDASSATSTCSIVVDVDSDQDLSFTTPTGNFDRYTDGGKCYYTIPGDDFDASDIPDACAGNSITVSGEITQEGSPIYSGFSTLAGYQLAKGENYSVVWTIEDEGGLSISSTPFTISVFDDQEPSFTCYGNNILSTDSGEADYTVSGTEFDPTGISDNCDAVFDISYTINGTPGAGSSMAETQLLTGNHTIIWTVEDQSGNSDDCSFIITIEDNEAPEISTVSNATRSADSGTCFYTASGGEFDPVASDNVGVTEFINLVNNSTSLDGFEFPVGSTNVVWRATDAAGNITTMEYTVTVSDDENPTFDLVSSATRYANSSCYYRVSGTEFNPTNYSDNCTSGGFLVTNDYNSYRSLAYEDLPVGTTTINWTVTDLQGNSTTDQISVTVLDTISPTIICPSYAYIRLSDSGQDYYTVSGNELRPYSYDNCSVNSMTNDYNGLSNLNGEQLPEGTHTIVWTATDDSGNTTDCSVTVVVTDSYFPPITCLSDQTRSTDSGECYYTISGDEFEPTLAYGSATFTYRLDYGSYVSSLNGETLSTGDHFIRCRATWNLGGTDYSSYCGFYVTVSDNEAPDITPLDDVTVNSNFNCWATVSLGTLVATDNCTSAGNLDISNDQYDNYYYVGTTSVTWTVEDEAGNTSTYVQTVTVIDDDAPSISCLPSDIYVEANDPSGTFYIASDNEFNPPMTEYCSNPTTYTHDFAGSAGNTTLAGDSIPLGSTTITWIATDSAGNSDTCTFTIHVQSTADPHISCHGPKWRSTDTGLCSYDVSGTEFDVSTTTPGTTLSHNISGAPLTGSLDGSTLPRGTNTIVWTATDGSGNTSTCSFNVYVRDWEDPVVNCPNDTTVSMDSGSCSRLYSTLSLNGPTATDNCTAVEDINITNDAPVSFEAGNTTVRYHIYDDYGNDVYCYQTVTVIDDQDPVIDCPAEAYFREFDNTEVEYYTAIGAEMRPSTTDNCTLSSLTNDITGTSYLNGETFGIGSHNVTWTATDNSGNTATCTIDLEVVESFEPLLECVEDTVRSTDAGNCTYAVVGDEFDPENISTSIHPTFSMTHDYASAPSDTTLAGAEFAPGTHTVTWTATQTINGTLYTTICVFDLTVNDDQDPLFTESPTDLTLNVDPGTCEKYYELDTISATDNCPGYTITNNAPGDNYFPKGETIVRWYVTDADGNTTSVDQSITVIDNEGPVISDCPANPAAVTATGSSCQASVSWTLPTAADDCSGIDSFTSTHDPGNLFDIGTTTVTYTATDNAGNVSTCSFDVTVLDETPTISCVDDTVRTTNPGVCSYHVMGNEFDPVSFGDNCSVSSVEYSFFDGTSTITGNNTLSGVVIPRGDHPGLTTITWTITDNNGNEETCNFDLTIEDDENPVLTVPSDQTRPTDTNQDYYTTSGSEFDITTESDNCGITTYYYNGSEKDPATIDGTQFSVGEHTITWTTEDAAGNQSDGHFTLIVEDQEAPRLLTAESGDSVPNDAGDCGAVVNYTEPTFIDNVSPTDSLDITVIPSSASSGSYFDLGTTSVMYIVEDTSGNIYNYFFDVTVYDNEDPVITCPAGSPFSRNTDEGYDTYTAIGTEFDPSAYDDNCSASITNDYNGLGSLAGASFPMGTTTVTWTVTDDADNTATCSIDIVITDIDEPAISNCPEATISEVADIGDCYYEIMSSDYDPYGFSDNDDLDKLTYSINGGEEVGTDLTTSLVGAQIAVGTDVQPTTTVEWRLYDLSGNYTTCTSVFTITDDQLPDISCPGNKTRDTDTGVGYYTVTALDNWDPTVSDNCGVDIITYTINSGSPVGTDAGTSLEGVQFSVGTDTVKWVVYDIHGNADSCTFKVTIEDNEAPSMTCNPLTVELDETGSYTLDAADIANIGSGTTDPSGIASMSVHPDDFNCYDVGENTVTLTATDNYGNIGTCTTTITVEDNIDPTALCNDLTVQLDAFGSAVITAAQLNNGSSDNCSISTISADQTSFNCTDVGENTVTLTVTDANGNSSTCTGTVTVQDVDSPTAVCQNIVRYLDASGNVSITGTDIDNGSYDNCSNLTLTPSLTDFTCSDIGDNSVTLTVTDAGGNSDNCSATVTILDTLPPVVVCQDITIQLDVSGNASIAVDDIDNGSTDNCGIDSRVLSTTDFTCSDVGENTVTLTVTDVNGNSSTCDATVTVEDIPATAICQDITIELDSSGNASIVAADIDNGSSDACGAVSLAIDKSDFTCSDVGANTVTLTVTDVNSNTSTCTSTVTVQDNIAPDVICQNLTIYLDASGNASITPEEVDNGSSDACGIDNLSLDKTAFTCSDLGENTVSLTVTDVNGNSDNCTASITVLDTISPVAAAQNITIALDNTGNITITGNDINNGSSDNCSISSYTAIPASFDCSDIGENTVSLVVEDPAGNTDTTTCTVTVEDNTAPNAICKNITVNLNSSGNASITANDINNGSNDACGIQSISADITSFSCSDIGTNNVTLTVTDVNGNSSQCVSTVTIADVTDPDITCAVTGDQAVTTDTDVCTYTHPDLSWDASANDECTTISSLTYTLSGATTSVTAPNTSLNGQVFEKGTTTVIWTAIDGSGNSSDCSFTVTVTDDQNPNAICQDATVYLDINGDVTVAPADINNGSNDNCTNISLMISKESSPNAWNTSLDYDCSELGTSAINLQVRDDASNISTCSANLTVLDTIAPTHDDLSDRIVTTDADECTYTHQTDIWNVYDNCDPNPTITYTLSGATTTITLPNTSLNGQVFEKGTTTVTWTSEDASGNTSTTEFNVIVNDEQNPTISCPSDITQNVSSAGATSTSVTEIPSPTYDDNCSVTQVTWVMTGATTGAESSAGYNHVNSGIFNVGTTNITYTAYDAAGNTETCSFEITIDALDGAIVADPSTVETSEPNIADSFDITLGSAPTGTVVLDVVSSDLTEATVSPATLTFNAGNWDTPQTVTVTGVNDDVDDDDQAYTVTLSIDTDNTEVTSGYYNATDIVVNATNLDDDDAGYTVSAISGHTSEDLDAQTFTVQLSTEPVADVSLTLSSSDLTEGDVTSSTNLTFTSANWDTPQTVTVTGIDDDIVDGNVAYQIDLSNASSSDPKYNGLFATNVAVINDDNDNAGFTITPTSGLETTEDEGTATFDVVLTSKPATDAEDFVVVIDVVSDDLTEGTVSTDELTFTAANWDTPQTVTITGVDDAIVDGDIPYTVQLSLDAVNTTDPVYVAPLDPTDVSVTNLDNDEAVISISDETVIEGNSGTTAMQFTVTHSGAEVPAGYTVSYYSQNVNATTPSDYTPVGGSISFDGSIGETETITVNINGDEMVEPNETFKLVLSYINAPGLNVVLHDTDNTGTGTISNDDNATFAINDVSVTEGNSGTKTMSFTVSLSQDIEASNPITVDYATSNVTATTADSDYNSKSGTVSFTGIAGETETISITINGDTKVEMDETYQVNLSNIQSAGLPAPILAQITFLDSIGVGTIQNDDAAQISITDVTANETHSGTTSFDFTVSLDYASDAAVSVDYATADGTALVSDVDYNALSTTTLTFAAGETSKTVSVEVNGDTEVELNETFTLGLSNLIDNGRSITIADNTGLGTIVNDDSANITIDDVSITEGDSGTSTLTFTVTHNGNSLDVPFSVDYASSNVTALTSDSDYSAVSGTLNFSGTTAETQTIDVTINGDTKVELDETFEINLSNLQASGRNISIADDTGIGTIENDDSAVISINDITHDEGDSGTTSYEFTITMSDISDANVSLDWTSADNTALTADSDYTGDSGSLLFTPGQTSKTVTILVNGDTKVELDETFFINLSNLNDNSRNISFADDSGLGTITNDDAITIDITGVSQNETDSGQTTFTFDVDMSTTSDANVVLNYATSDNTALIADSDYDAASGTLTFTPGNTHLTFDVMVNGDTKVEMDETFVATISENEFNGRNISISTASDNGTILNDDSAEISITDVTANETHSGTTSFDFTVSLDYASDAAVSVDYATADGTALVSDVDYNALSTTTLTFAAGETSKTVSVEVNGDTEVELDETFTLGLSNLIDNGRSITIADNTGLGTIVNDDSANITIDDVSITEGDSGTSTLTFTVTHNGNSLDVPFSVDYASSNVTALTSDSDYSAVSGTLNFSGTTAETQTIDVTINGDLKVELDETFEINLSNLQASGRNISIADDTGIGTIENDDSAVISINDITHDEGYSGTTSYEFTITMSAVSDANVGLNWASADNTATITDSDYNSDSGSLLFTPGQTSKTVTILVNGDTQVEPDETFTIELSELSNNSRDISISDGSGLGTITNDDQANVNISSVSEVETDSGQTGFVFTVTLTDPSAATTTVDYATSDGTALVADGDYDAATGTLTFVPGDTEETFTVYVNGDTKVESDETFTATLSNLVQGGLEVYMGTPSGTGTIENDDSAVINVADVTQNEGNSGTTDFDFIISMDYPSDAIVTVDYVTADGSANSGTDYTAYTTTTLTFNPGEVSKTVTVGVLTDVIAEPDETFTFSISNLVNNGRNISINDGSATGTIWNDDAPSSFAGIDAEICQNDTYSLADATANNYNSLLWETSGDGTFSDNSILNPVYTPGTNDIAAGTVTLTLTAEGMGVNISDAVDQMELAISWVTWTGAVNSDWNVQGNWCADIPTIHDQVLIPAAAENQPVITSATAYVKDLTLESGASLGFENDMSLEVYNIFINNGTINAGSGEEYIIFKGENSEFTTGGSAINNLEIDDDDADASLLIHDNLTIYGDVNLKGNYTHNNMDITLNGTGVQNVNVEISSINNMTVNNSYTGDHAIVLQSDLNISGQLTLTDGVINTGLHTIIMEDGSSSDMGSISSFVDGNMSKIGSTAFTFPVGDITMRDFGEGDASYTVFAPFGMTPEAPTTVAVRYAYSNDGMPQWWYHEWSHEAPLNHTTDRENWLVSSGENLQNVTLYWSDNDHAVDEFCTHGFCSGNPADHSLSQMTVAYWNNIWKDAGGVAVATSEDVHDSGSITATTTIPFMGAKSQTFITFGSKESDSPLPVELVEFETNCDQSDVILKWETASETNNDYFVIERSVDNKHFTSIGTVDGNGNSVTSSYYSYTDIKTDEGTWYYRLIQVDNDGSRNIIGLAAADCYDSNSDIESYLVEAYPNPFKDYIEVQITSNHEGIVEIELIDETGRTVMKENHYKTVDQHIINLYPGDMKPSMYYLRIKFNEDMHYIKLIRQ